MGAMRAAGAGSGLVVELGNLGFLDFRGLLGAGSGVGSLEIRSTNLGSGYAGTVFTAHEGYFRISPS